MTIRSKLPQLKLMALFLECGFSPGNDAPAGVSGQPMISAGATPTGTVATGDRRSGTEGGQKLNIELLALHVEISDVRMCP